MTLWNDIVSGICLLLLTGLLWKEFRRADRFRLWLRVLATVVAVAGLAGLALPLSFRKEVAISGDKTAVLLTEGYDTALLQAYLHSAPEGIPVFSPEEWKDGSETFSKLHVFGYGLTKEEWSGLRPPPLIFHPSASHTGVRDISWQKTLSPGEELRIEGRLVLTAGKGVRVLLRGMNRTLDSVELKEGSQERTEDFVLHTVPAFKGRAGFQLVLLSYGHPADTLEQEEIPVQVLPAKPLKVLVLASSPGFENRFLVSWLAQQGSSAAVRTAISKDKYEKAYLNMQEVPLTSLGPALLDKFDLLLADVPALRALNGEEVTNLRKAVREKGLGVIIQADSTGGGVTGLFPGMTGSGLYGAGQLESITEGDSYTRLLAGDRKEYAAYWSALLQQAARRSDPAGWQVRNELPRVGDPVQLQLQRDGAGWFRGQAGTAGMEPAVLYLRQRPFFSFSQEAVYWPQKTGWQLVQTAAEGDSSWWYVWPRKAWQELYRQQRRRETQAYISDPGQGESGAIPASGQQEAAAGRTPIDKAWFYVLLLIGCLALWVERKIG